MSRYNLIFRKSNPAFNSIENVFNTLLPLWKDNGIKVELPYANSGITNRLKNIFFIKKKYEKKLIHITGHDHYISFGSSKEKTILTIHDVEFIKRSKGLKKFLLKKIWMDWPISRVKILTTVSEFSKQEILSLKNYKTPIVVIHNPITLPIKKKEKEFNEKIPNILHIGTKKNKNLHRLISALKGIECHLTIIGKISTSIKIHLQENNINYTCKQNISNKSMIAEYENCDILAFISTYEGFGLPIIEAQSCGRAVITANISSMPEIAGDAAILVNPYSIGDINKQINKLINEPEFRNSIIEKGFENVKRYKPEIIASQYEKLYNEILND